MLAVATAVTISAAGPAQAAVTCRIVPSLCPPEPHKGGKGDSVPEPATLAVLAAGAAAASRAGADRPVGSAPAQLLAYAKYGVEPRFGSSMDV